MGFPDMAATGALCTDRKRVTFVELSHEARFVKGSASLERPPISYDGLVMSVGFMVGASTDFGGSFFHGRRYLAQIGGASRNAPCKTAIGYRDRPRGTTLRPRSPLLSHG